MYLDAADSGTLPNGWSRYVQFSLAVVNQIHSKDSVTKVDVKRVLEEQYGGWEELPQTNPGFNNTPFKFTRYSNAYMLVDIQDSDKEKIICNVDEKDIAEHLRIRLKKEQEEKEDKRRYKAQAHLYTVIKNPNLVMANRRRLQKSLAYQCSFSVSGFGPRDKTTHIAPVTPQEEAQSVGQLRGVSSQHSAELKLFLEVEFGPNLRPIPPPDKTKEDILLFFKLYEPEKQELRFVGRLSLKSFTKPVEILTKLNQLAGFSLDDELEIYEVKRYHPNAELRLLEVLDHKIYKPALFVMTVAS
ncbi:hypothetical protein C1H46_003537 [Malus baccata]|uniref:Ubiquitin carboxyl-terminal hydrolase 7 ICP0-binding domain-containing protein n=1 Tax=Malus baccata TaxID=106549 RepID=A0A540NIG2_MALBA|nr:hypothetical protein C1H46_003537 [Malus baccata]